MLNSFGPLYRLVNIVFDYPRAIAEPFVAGQYLLVQHANGY